MDQSRIEEFAYDSVVGMSSLPADDRTREIVLRVLTDLLTTIEELDIEASEWWGAIDFLEDAAKADELKLITAGLGIDRFLDLRKDIEEATVGMAGGTPRSIEGPLYVAGAPVERGYARMDDGSEPQAEVLFLQGMVCDLNGEPLADARVEIWHANSKGSYSYFDTSQTAFNLRRTIITDSKGRYRVRTTMPKGYAVPEGGYAEQLLHLLGRHGNRPAHIHFFVSAKGYRTLTTQINIQGSDFLWEDYAFAEREGLLPPLTRITDATALEELSVDTPCSSIDFDIRLYQENEDAPDAEVDRKRPHG